MHFLAYWKLKLIEVAQVEKPLCVLCVFGKLRYPLDI